MADEPSASAEQPVSSQLREAAKWLIASFGAIAAVVAAGIQFGDVGKLSGWDLRWALAGAALAFGGIGAATYAVMRLLVPRARSVTELDTANADDPAVKYMTNNPEVLQGYTSIGNLRQARDEDRATYQTALQAWRNQPSQQTAAAVKTAAALQAPTDAIADNVVFWANYQTLKRDFDRAMRRFVLPGIGAAAVGLTLFAIKVSEPASPSSASLKAAQLSNATLHGSDLHNADLSGADLSAADLTDADLSNADLTGSKFDGANLTGANLKGAMTDKTTSFAGATWHQTHCPDGTSSDQADNSCLAHLHGEEKSSSNP
jgi:hypothetical protein